MQTHIIKIKYVYCQGLNETGHLFSGFLTSAGVTFKCKQKMKA